MRTEVAVSTVTVWELVLKASHGQLPPLPKARGSFARHLGALGFRHEPFAWMDAEIEF